MPQLQFKTPHTLSPDEATARIKVRIKDEIGKAAHLVSDMKENWLDSNHAEFSFKAYGFAVDGKMFSEPGEVNVSLNLPFAAMMIKGMIESQLKGALNQILSETV